MKKILYFIIVLIITILYTNNKAFSECPPGYSSHSITKMYSYNIGPTLMQCPFTIDYCCRWNPETHQVEAIIESITLPNYACWIFIPDWANFFQWVNKTTAIAAYQSCGPQYPPCDDPNNYNIITKVRSIHCKKFKNYFPILGDDVMVTKILNCDYSNYCEDTYKLCSDYSKVDENGRPLTVVEFVSTQQIGTPNCSNIMPQLPPWGETWDTVWETECFTNGCN